MTYIKLSLPTRNWDRAYFFLLLIEDISAPPKDVIIDKARTAKRLRKQGCLFGRGVEAVLVGAFSHVLHYFILNVRIKRIYFAYIPALKDGVLRAFG